MEKFANIFERACAHKGGVQALKAELPSHASAKKLASIPAEAYLSMMTKRIFQVGFNWSVVDKKWDGFETVFHGFDIGFLLMIPDEEYEHFRRDERIIRNFTKIKSIKHNAQFIADIEKEHGSFGKWIANWPCSDLIGLFAELKRRASRLGGMTGSYVLRSIGKDTFLLTPDVVTALQNADVIDAKPTSKKALKQVQEAFNEWHAESKYSYGQMSKILACSIG